MYFVGRIEVAQQYMLQLGSMLDYARRKDEDMYRMFEIAGEVKDFPVSSQTCFSFQRQP